MPPPSFKSWDLNHLAILVDVARLGSLTKVAAGTGMTQPAVSRVVSRLERQCGGRLFLRTGRGMVPSDLGKQVLPIVHEVLKYSDQLSQQVSVSAGALTGDVRLGIVPSLNKSMVVPLLRHLRARAPGIRMRVYDGSAGQIDQWLVSGAVDIGVTYRNDPELPLNMEQLYTVDTCLVGAATDPLLKARQVTVHQLDDLPLVLPAAPSAMRMLLAHLARKRNLRLNIVVEAESSLLQLDIAAAGIAYALLPEHLVAEANSTGRLRATPIADPSMRRFIVMGTTSGAPSSLAGREVARMIRSILPLGQPR